MPHRSSGRTQALITKNLMVSADDEPTSASVIRRSKKSQGNLLVSNLSVEIAFFVVLAWPATSFARYSISLRKIPRLK
jgi:hypothetical protein